MDKLAVILAINEETMKGLEKDLRALSSPTVTIDEIEKHDSDMDKIMAVKYKETREELSAIANRISGIINNVE